MSSKIIKIAAAEDLRYTITELCEHYKELYPDIITEIFPNSSGMLFKQISTHVPFDIFFSADVKYPNKLEELKLTVGKPTIFAIGQLVLWSSKKDVSKGLEMLLSDDIGNISIANPEVAPYGKRAFEALIYYKIFDQVKNKIVIAEDVLRAGQTILNGYSDAGLIALSLARATEFSERGKYFLIDEKSYSRPEQAFVILKQSKETTDFIKYLESNKAKDILRKYGFRIPQK